MLPAVSADDLGNPEKPGDYIVDGIHFEVEQRHIDVRKADPDVRFRRMKQTRVDDNQDRLILAESE